MDVELVSEPSCYSTNTNCIPDQGHLCMLINNVPMAERRVAIHTQTFYITQTISNYALK
jgi:hypothetical protein